MKNVSNLVVMSMVFALTACSGGGGGGGGGTGTGGGGTVYGCMDSSALNYNSSATVSDGSCSYSGGGGAGTGTAAFYGVSTANTTVLSNVDETTLDGVVSGTNVKISSEFYMHVTNATTKNFELYVYQPTCPVGATENKYAAVLVSGSSTSPTVVQVVQTSSGIKVVERKAKQTINSGPLYPFIMEDVATETTVSGSCDSNSGIMTLSSSAGTVLGNGKMLLVKKSNGDVYMGIHENKIAADTTTLTTGNYDLYTYASAMTNEVSASGGAGMNVITSTASGECSKISGACLKIPVGFPNSDTYDIKKTADNGATTTYLAVSHFAMFSGTQGTGQTAKIGWGVMADNIGGKSVVVVTRPVSDAGDGSGGTTSIQGSGRIEIAVSQ